MPEITQDALLRSLRDRAGGGVYFFHGEEEYLREEAVARVVERHLDPATRDFNYDQVAGPDVAADALASLVATPPMMAERRVVVVRAAQGLSVKAREVVEAAAKAPPEGLVLVLSAAIPSGSKAKFYTELQKRATSVEFPALEPLDAPGWLMERARSAHGVELEPDAAGALVSAVGTSLGTLTSELAKLAGYVQDRGRITADDVRAVGVAVPRFDRWAWFDLIGERRLGEALRVLPTLLEGGESGVGLVIGMAQQLLRVALVCAGGQGALERELKPYQKWLARKVAPQARRWTLPEVDAALTELLRTDRLLKSASLSDRQAMEELLLRLMALRPPRESAA
ncbi:MAG TPA: DNA polymerase III subunit delta [Longimicrobiaceae bacterium]|nr:DNA polymerase III subunit delta [Longimicrobiaceae bacterium]